MTVEKVDIITRSATTADVQRIAEIGRTTFKSSFGHSMPEHDMAEYLDQVYIDDAISREFSDDSNTFFVATDGDHVCGFVQMKVGTTEPCLPDNAVLCEVHRVYVDQQFHSQGIGDKLMQVALDWGVNHLEEVIKTSSTAQNYVVPKAGLWLGVWDENLKAQKFYKRYGFDYAGGSHDFVMGSTIQTDLIYARWR